MKRTIQSLAAEAYQVIGAISVGSGSSPEINRALDYFGNVANNEQHESSILPFYCDFSSELAEMEKRALAAEIKLVGKDEAMQIAAQWLEDNPRDLLVHKLTTLLSEANDKITDLKSQIEAESIVSGSYRNERDFLQSKLAEMEKQQPVGEIEIAGNNSNPKFYLLDKSCDLTTYNCFKVYALPVQPSTANPKRITEQDARELITAYTLWRGTEYNQLMADKFSAGYITCEQGRNILAKLNEDREPDYKAQRDEMLSAMMRYLQFIPESTAKNGGAASFSEMIKAADQFREAIAKANESNTGDIK